MANVYNVSFVIDALTSGAFSKTFSNAGKTMGELQKKMASLSQNQAAIASFGKLQAVANTNGAALNAAQARVRALGEQMRATANPSEQMKRQFTAAHVAAHKLQEKLMGQRKELGQLRSSLSAAGVDTKNFSNEQARLAQSTKQAADAAKLQAAQARLQQAQGKFDSTKQELSWNNIKAQKYSSLCTHTVRETVHRQASS